MTWQAAGYASALMVLFAIAMRMWRLEAMIVSLILFMGWLAGQILQQFMSYRELVEIFWIIDFASAMILFGLFNAGMSWWVWFTATIYALMVTGHAVLFKGVMYEWEWATDYNHWKYTSALFALQILTVFFGGVVYGRNERFNYWLRHVSFRLKDHFGGVQNSKEQT